MDISSIEIFLIIVIAFLVLGPKDLAIHMQRLGRFWGGIKTQINNFQVLAKEELNKQVEVEELKDLKNTLDEDIDLINKEKS